MRSNRNGTLRIAFKLRLNLTAATAQEKTASPLCGDTFMLTRWANARSDECHRVPANSPKPACQGWQNCCQSHTKQAANRCLNEEASASDSEENEHALRQNPETRSAPKNSNSLGMSGGPARI